jgi:hypothetical protein
MLKPLAVWQSNRRVSMLRVLVSSALLRLRNLEQPQ